MSEKALQFTRLDIRRMPGFRGNTGFSIQKIAGGINIIYGPNGSGKTTMARSLNSILWPSTAPNQSEIEGRFQTASDSWTLEVTRGRLNLCRKNGKESDAPLLPDEEAMERYNFDLRKLLLEEESCSFAEAINREATGGYDLEEAGKKTGARQKASSQNIKEKTNYDKAGKKYREAIQKQQRIEEEEKKLELLTREKDKAQEALTLKDSIQAAIEIVKSRVKLDSIKKALELFPGNMDKVRKDDGESLKTLKKNIKTEETEKNRLEEIISAARETIISTGLNREKATGEQITILRKKQRTLQELQVKISRLEDELPALKQNRDQIANLFEGEVNQEKLCHAGLRELGDISNFARSSEKLRARREFIQKASKWLDSSKEATSRGTASRKKQLSRLLAILEILLIAATSAGVFFVHHWLFFIILVIQLASAFLIFKPEKQGGKVDELSVRKKDLEVEEEKLEKEIKQHEGEKQLLFKRTGIEPGLECAMDEAVFFFLVEKLNRWQLSNEEVLKSEKELETTRNRFNSQLKEINIIFAGFDIKASSGHDEVFSNTEQLDKRFSIFNKAATDIKNAETNLRLITKRLSNYRAELNQLFERYSLDAENETTLLKRLSLLPDFNKKIKLQDQAQFNLVNAERRFSSLKGDPLLLDLDEAELEIKRKDAEDLSLKLSDLSEEIGGIKDRVKQAKEAHDVEEALMLQAEYLGELQNKLEEDLAACATWELVDYLKHETREHSRPPVFRKAREIFSGITGGEYKLELNDSDHALFSAEEIETGESKRLDELSAATKLQLFLAVRIAFVELEEQGTWLPLFFDESLANSDDERAVEIIRTVINLSRRGRQIFYFTAQADEVNKWKKILDKENFRDFRVTDLAELRRLDLAKKLPLAETAPEVKKTVPHFGGMTYLEYGKLLNVPALDPYAEGIGSFHLWHLFDNPETLYNLLVKRITTWGRLEYLAEAKGLGNLGISEEIFLKAEAAAKAIKKAISIRRVGHGRKVDRDVLIKSGQVSDGFLEAVTKKSRELNGNGKALIKAIEQKEIPKFREEKREQLNAYFIENGYIDMNEAINKETAETIVLESLGKEIKNGQISCDRIIELVGRIFDFELIHNNI